MLVSLSGNIDSLEAQRGGLGWLQKAFALDLVCRAISFTPGALLTLKQNFQIAALEVQLAGAKIGLGVAEGVLNLTYNIMQSSLFRELKEAWYRANEMVETIKRKVELAVNQARDQLNNAKKLFEVLESTVNGDFETAERKAKAMVSEAQKIYDDYRTQQDLESEKLKLQMSALKNSALSTAVTAAEGTLEFAKNNNIAFQAAQAGLDAVKIVEGVVYETLNSMIKAAANLCDVRVIRLNGTITADASKQQPFTIHLEGTLVGQEFNFDVYYTPGQTKEFLERLTKRAFEHLKLT